MKIHLKRSGLFDDPCHEGNYDAMRGLLLGARAQEK